MFPCRDYPTARVGGASNQPTVRFVSRAGQRARTRLRDIVPGD